MTRAESHSDNDSDRDCDPMVKIMICDRDDDDRDVGGVVADNSQANGGVHPFMRGAVAIVHALNT